MIKNGSAGYIWHYRQDKIYGCYALSYYAMTGDKSFLQLEHETSTPRLENIAAQLGWMTYAEFVNPDAHMPLSAWDRYVPQNNGGFWRYLLCIDSPVEGLRHSVAIAIIRTERSGQVIVQISDSVQSDPLECDWQEFLESRYARVRGVATVYPIASLADAYPPTDPLVAIARAKTQHGGHQ